MTESKQERFNRRYESGETPWELDRPDQDLEHFVRTRPLLPCRVLELGCGTGANAVWLAGQGFDVTGIDFAASALDQARARAKESGITFLAADFLCDRVPGAPFDFLFDRGCFHSFDAPESRRRFAMNAQAHLSPGGLWLSFIGNADGPPRKDGPPVRSAAQIVAAVEPFFEILYLKSAVFDSEREVPPRNWQVLMKKRPA